MERVKITLVDNNYTQVFDTDIYMDAADLTKLNSLLCCVQDGLYADHEQRLAITGPLNTAMELTVTGCEHC
jgi:hypothetical protein